MNFSLTKSAGFSGVGMPSPVSESRRSQPPREYVRQTLKPKPSLSGKKNPFTTSGY